MKNDKLKKCNAVVLAATVMSTLAAGFISMNQPIIAAAADSNVYVDSSAGNDASGNGSSTKPYKTIEKAANSVANNGTIIIKGTYSCAAQQNLGASGKQITISGGTLNISGSSTVNFNGPTTLSSIKVKANNNGSIYANGNKLVIQDSVTFEGTQKYIYGGSNSKELNSTDITLNAGNYSNIFGGSNSKKITGDTHVNIGNNVNKGVNVFANNHANMGKYTVYGGSYNGEICGSSYVVVNGTNAVVGGIYGAGTGSNSSVHNTSSVTLNNGTVYSIYGGAINSNGYAGTVAKVTITGGTVGQVFGGSCNGNLTGSTKVLITGGTLARRVYGGCYNDLEHSQNNYHVIGSTFLAIGNKVKCNYDLDTDDKYEDNVISACSRSTKHFSDETSTMWITPTLYSTWFNHEGFKGSWNDWMLSSTFGYPQVQLMLRGTKSVDYDNKYSNIKGKPYYLIDPNHDGQTNLKDVVIFERYLAGWDVEFNPAENDVNGDGKTNISDVILLKSFVADCSGF